MAIRAWTGPVATAIGVAAGASAAQLGFGYGLGIIAWAPSAGGTGETKWVAGLTWATWIAATATIVGASCAARLAGVGSDQAGRGGATDRASVGALPGPVTGLRRFTLALAAGLGALVTVVLVAVPARLATPAETLAPQATAAGHAAIGVLIGVVMAAWALSSPAVSGNLIATACWLWLLATAVVIDTVFSGQHLTGVHLGAWWTTGAGFHGYLQGALLSLGPALLIGGFAAWRSARTASLRVGATISGALGPLLVTAAHLLTAPRLVGTAAGQIWPHLMAPSAVITGLAGSALVAAYAQRADRRVRSDGTTGTDSGQVGDPGHPVNSATDPALREGDGLDVVPPATKSRVPAQPTADTDGGRAGAEPIADTTEPPAKSRPAIGSSRSTRRSR